jgi:hypothetical protein
VKLALSLSLPTPYRCLSFFLSSTPLSYNIYHHGPLTCKNYSIRSWVLSGTSASLENNMDHAHVSYRSRTMVFLLEKGSVPMFPCTAQKLGIHSCGVLMSCMWDTKQIIFFLFPYSGSIECEVLQILLQIFYCWIYLPILVLFH